MNCLEFEMIADWVDNRLEQGRKGSVKKHIEGCSTCSETRNWLLKATAAMTSRELVDAPEYVLERAISTFKKPQKLLPRIVEAVLRFDSWSEPLMAGVRSTDGGPRQLMYETSEFNVFLMLLPGPNQASVVLGQLVPSHPELEVQGWEVQLKGQDRILCRERTNQSGEFYLKTRLRNHLAAHASAPAKKVDLLIYRDDNSILLSDITGFHA